MFGKNKKTTLAGLGMLITAIADIFQGFASGDPGGINWQVDIASIIAGIGLWFAKDGNVTGGTVVQPTPVEASLLKIDEQAAQGLVAAGMVLAAKHIKQVVAQDAEQEGKKP